MSKKSKINAEELKSMIRYWIEVRHVQAIIEDLIEDTDEICEYYEGARWLSGSSRGKSTSLMDVHVILEEASNKCYSLSCMVDDGLKPILDTCRTQLPEVFGTYANEITDEAMGEICELLLEETPIEEVYAYTMDEQYENFCKVVQECCEEIMGSGQSGGSMDGDAGSDEE